MSNTPRRLTRNQLAEFLPNARAVRAFEQVLDQVGDLLPSDVATLNRLIQESYIEASTASANAAQALDTLGQISRSLELISQAPSIQPTQIDDDIPPVHRWSSVAELVDASVKLPVAGSLLIYDSTLKLWKNAVLAAGTNVTITNADGSVTINSSSSAVEIHAATSKPTPVDADELALADSAASFSLKKLTWLNIKATAKTYFDTLYQAANANLTTWASKSPPSGAVVGITDTQTLSSKTLTAPVVTGSLTHNGAVNDYHHDTSNNNVAIANLGTVDFSNFSGMLVAHDWSTGSVTIYLCGGAITTVVSTNGTQVGILVYNAGVAGYRWTNNSGATHTFSFFCLRTHSSA